MSSEEAERLSTVRFTSGLAGGARFSTVLSTDAAQHEEMSGQVDWKARVAEAVLTVKPQDGSVHHYTVVWNDTALAVLDMDAEKAGGPAKAWLPRPLDPRKTVFDKVAHTLLAIASDRPENPVLLASDGARWLRRDRVGSTPVEVFRGPGQRVGQQQPSETAEVSPEFWVDGDGHLARFRAPLPNGTFTADFSEWGSQQIADAGQLAAVSVQASPTSAAAPERGVENHSG